MSRSIAALAALLLLTAGTPAQKPKPKVDKSGFVKSTTDLQIRWHGQSFFEIVTTKGTRIITDPHNLDAYGRKEVQADLVLMSHFHNDHTFTEPTLITNVKSAKLLNALKKEDKAGVRVTWNVVDEKFKDVHIQSMGTYHDNMGGVLRGKNGVWIIDADGLRVVHLGDLGHQLNATQLKKLGKVDVLMVPVGGVYTLNGIDAQKVVEQIKPRRYVLPMHYGTEVYDDLLVLKYFLDEQPAGTPVQRFKPNQWLKLNAKAPLPKTYTLAVLHW
jgi:L-ascorbate metabolism protein UlaG (beta-lactamase superfamily)